MNLTTQRLVFVVVAALHGALLLAVDQNLFPSWTVFLGLACTLAGGLLQVLQPRIPPATVPARAVPPMALFALLAVVMLVVAACAHLPTPDGGSVSATDGGVETCIDWARRNCTGCVDAAGVPVFVDAAVGK